MRPATAADLGAIVQRWRELMEVHERIDPVLYATEAHASGTYRAFLRRQLDDKRGVLLVAEADGRIVGYLVGGFGRRAPMFSVREVGMIFDLVVSPTHRRRGLGERLVEVAEAEFRRMGLRYSQVNFAPTNESAAGFWPKQGFSVLLTEAYKALD